jgi:hypothetical protein
MATLPKKAMLTAEEIFGEFQISPTALRRWVMLGRLHPLREGNKFQFLRQEIVDAIEVGTFGDEAQRNPRQVGRDPAMG